MTTDSKEYPSTEEPLVQVLWVRFFTLPEETREVFRTDRNAEVSDPFTNAAKNALAI